MLARSSAVVAAGHPPRVRVDIDLGSFPDTASWAHEAAGAIPGWWKSIVNVLSVADFDRVQLQIREIDPRTIAALTIKNEINVDGRYVREGKVRIGLIAHELVHVAQDYPVRATNWIKEGMADYFRYHVLLPKDPERRAVSNQNDFRNGYQPAAALLAFLSMRFGSAIIRDLNAALRAGEDGDAAVRRLTGQPAEVWWREVLQNDRSLDRSPRL